MEVDIKEGLCKRYPPQRYSVSQHDVHSNVEILSYSDFPETWAESWCGEFQEKLTKSTEK